MPGEFSGAIRLSGEAQVFQSVSHTAMEGATARRAEIRHEDLMDEIVRKPVPFAIQLDQQTSASCLLQRGEHAWLIQTGACSCGKQERAWRNATGDGGEPKQLLRIRRQDGEPLAHAPRDILWRRPASRFLR
jgi:hypothetical protein